MGADAAIKRWRIMERVLMRNAGSTCTVTRPGPPGGFDPETGAYGDTETDTVYTGPCLVRLLGQATETMAAGQEVIETRPVVKIPDLSIDFAKGDVVTVTASKLDPGLVGTVLRVRDAEVDDWTVWRRLVCEVNE